MAAAHRARPIWDPLVMVFTGRLSRAGKTLNASVRFSFQGPRTLEPDDFVGSAVRGQQSIGDSLAGQDARIIFFDALPESVVPFGTGRTRGRSRAFREGRARNHSGSASRAAGQFGTPRAGRAAESSRAPGHVKAFFSGRARRGATIRDRAGLLRRYRRHTRGRPARG